MPAILFLWERAMPAILFLWERAMPAILFLWERAMPAIRARRARSGAHADRSCNREHGPLPHRQAAPVYPSCRSCTRASSSCAAIAPSVHRNMSHCVSHTSPWVPRNSIEAFSPITAVHHSMNS
jgi:hypothetical protein